MADGVFGLVSEAAPCFGKLLYDATKHVQTRLGFREAICTQAFCVRQSLAFHGATTLGWHQDTDVPDSMLTLVVNLSPSESRFEIAGFADSVYEGQGRAFLFDSTMFHKVVAKESETTKLIFHFKENARRESKAKPPKVWRKHFSGKSYTWSVKTLIHHPPYEHKFHLADDSLDTSDLHEFLKRRLTARLGEDAQATHVPAPVGIASEEAQERAAPSQLSRSGGAAEGCVGAANGRAERVLTSSSVPVGDAAPTPVAVSNSTNDDHVSCVRKRVGMGFDPKHAPVVKKRKTPVRDNCRKQVVAAFLESGNGFMPFSTLRTRVACGDCLTKIVAAESPRSFRPSQPSDVIKDGRISKNHNYPDDCCADEN
eukprot:6204147-Pleurochrysis_carterae.AAC.5